jgi:hypothetical protein
MSKAGALYFHTLALVSFGKVFDGTDRGRVKPANL